MTSHYIDITLLPDPEFNPAHLLGALVAKLHRALVRLHADQIGISFPGYSLRPRTLGDVLRLHGTEAELRSLMTEAWLQGMTDHVKVTRCVSVPPDAAHCVVQRRQFKTNVERLRRRRMRRKGESAEQAAVAIPDSVERRPHLPYVQLRSASTGQSFCLFVEQVVSASGAVAGTFNAYGLSCGGSVPWF
ncbi:type I-F CRISPR-associated endoribonuclease Cas6/Csy4 [Caballeronia sp. BCC1704]|uniref:type I-F CRISPR-associated endoribonuclease Cas6/Csy4 n=1 Tax=Caballeronia sp. BCC1704 TaxID=2676300 RepID=UPI00158BA82D|nr:type I-F CRISPR-associated endoribonuclease Cas6/Csy4 [Caballeronia sp. BCC1704]